MTSISWFQEGKHIHHHITVMRNTKKPPQTKKEESFKDEKANWVSTRIAVNSVIENSLNSHLH